MKAFAWTLAVESGVSEVKIYDLGYLAGMQISRGQIAAILHGLGTTLCPRTAGHFSRRIAEQPMAAPRCNPLQHNQPVKGRYGIPFDGGMKYFTLVVPFDPAMLKFLLNMWKHQD